MSDRQDNLWGLADAAAWGLQQAIAMHDMDGVERSLKLIRNAALLACGAPKEAVTPVIPRR